MGWIKRREIWLVAATCLFLSYGAGFGVYHLEDGFAQAREPNQFKVFWEAWDKTKKNFYGDLPTPQERTYGAIRRSLELLEDPYTVFVEPQARELEQDRLRGSYGGIEVTLWRSEEGRIFLSPQADSPAERAGIQKNDILLGVDGELVSGRSISDVKSQLHGKVGTTVTLTLSRSPAPPFALAVERGEIRTPSVAWRMLDRAPGIAYLRFDSFTDRTDEEAATALEEVQEAQASGLIVDLRDNTGGLVDPAITIADQFLQQGVILYQQSHDGEQEFEAHRGGGATDIPLVVLVNKGTASASEIIAGALQDHGRVKLIGESTFGKGSVQEIYGLSDGSSLHVTSAVWLTPARRKIQGRGLTPDIQVAPGGGPEDEQLNRAVDYLRAHH